MGDRPSIFSAATVYAIIGQRPQLPILALHRILFMRAWPGASSGIKCDIHFAKSLFTLNNRKIFIRTLIQIRTAKPLQIRFQGSAYTSRAWVPAHHELHDNMEQPGRRRAQSGRLAAKVSLSGCSSYGHCSTSSSSFTSP